MVVLHDGVVSDVSNVVPGSAGAGRFVVLDVSNVLDVSDAAGVFDGTNGTFETGCPTRCATSMSKQAVRERQAKELTTMFSSFSIISFSFLIWCVRSERGPGSI